MLKFRINLLDPGYTNLPFAMSEVGANFELLSMIYPDISESLMLITNKMNLLIQNISKTVLQLFRFCLKSF